MTKNIKEKFIDFFWKSIKDVRWDVWCDTSTTDKERIAAAAAVELGFSEDINEVYDLFWEWANGLEKDSFLEFEFEFNDNEDQ